MLLRVFVCGVLGLLPYNAFAGAWTLPEGEGQTIVTASFYHTREAFNAQGERGRAPLFQKYELNPYTEYGLTDGLTVGVSAFAQSLKQEMQPGGPIATTEGLGETELFARWRLWEADGGIVSVQPLLKLPSAYLQAGNPRAGRTAWDAELALQGGYGFDAYGQHHYLDTRIAYRYRSDALGDQLRASARLGLGIKHDLTLLSELEYTGRAQGGGNVLSIAGQNDYTLWRAQMSVVWAFADRYALQLGAFQHIAGEDTGAGGGVLVALWRRW